MKQLLISTAIVLVANAAVASGDGFEFGLSGTESDTAFTASYIQEGLDIAFDFAEGSENRRKVSLKYDVLADEKAELSFGLEKDFSTGEFYWNITGSFQFN